MQARILLVEDERGVAVVVSDLLSGEGYQVEVAADGHIGLKKALDGKFDLLVLDVLLPGKNGFEICRAVRQAGFDGGILMLTAKGQVSDRVLGLRGGADDYLLKPFDSAELVARVEALLRRINKGDLTPVMNYSVGRLSFDFAKMVFLKNRKPLTLTAKEFELLRYLNNYRGQILSRKQILYPMFDVSIRKTQVSSGRMMVGREIQPRVRISAVTGKDSKS